MAQQAEQHSPGLPHYLEAGQSLSDGAYTVEHLISQGGFACIYRAYDKMGRTVAIKEFFQGDCCLRTDEGDVAPIASRQALFDRLLHVCRTESEILAGLDHPNVVRSLDRFEDRGTFYMVLEFFPGADLETILTNHAGWLQPDQALQIAESLVDALDHLHGQGILHGDLSPDNVLLRDPVTPVLIDIGAADVPGKSGARPLRMVKDGYTAPELYDHKATPSIASEIHALGATLFHLLSGRPAPAASDRAEMVAAGLADPCADPSATGLFCPPAVAAAIARAMSTDPAERFASAADFRQALDETIETYPEIGPQFLTGAQKPPPLMPTTNQLKENDCADGAGTHEKGASEPCR